MRRKVDPRHDLLSGPLAKGNALLHRGGHGASELRLVVPERIVARGHHVLGARLERAPRAQLADDPLADLLEDRGDLRIGGRLLGAKTWREPLGGAVLIDPLKEDQVVMQIQIDASTEALQERHRAGLHGGPRGALLHGVIDIILPDGAADNGMDCGGELSGGRHPITKGNGYRDDPLPRGYPGNHLLDEMGRLLRHAPAGTRGAKSALFTAEGQHHLVRTGITPQAHQAVGQDAALQVGVKFLGDVMGPAIPANGLALLYDYSVGAICWRFDPQFCSGVDPAAIGPFSTPG